MLIDEGSPTPGGGSLWTNLRDISIQHDFWLYQQIRAIFFNEERFKATETCSLSS